MPTHRHRWEGIDAHACQRYQDDADTDQRHDLGVDEGEKTRDQAPAGSRNFNRGISGMGFCKILGFFGTGLA